VAYRRRLRGTRRCAGAAGGAAVRRCADPAAWDDGSVSGYGDQIPALPPAPVVSAPPGGTRRSRHRAAAAAGGAPAMPAPGALVTGHPAGYPHPAAPGAPSVGDLRLDARSPRSSGLGPAFAGAPASTGIRLLAFTIDAIVALCAAGLVFWLTQSVVLGILAFFE